MTVTSTPTLITTPFGSTSTAMEVIDGVDLSGKRAVVTGGSSGIGIHTARALAAAGAEVTITERDLTVGRAVVAAIVASTGRANVRVAPLELADRCSIDRLVAAWDGPLDILINNAGVMQIPRLTLTPDGHELHFAANHLGHFALALGLHDALTRAGDARIISVSSVGHLRSPVVFDDINFASRPYDPRLAYGQSKTANVLFAVEVTRRWAADGITANAVHPGSIADTNLSRYMDPDARAALVGWAWDTYFPKTPQQGAATSVLLATSPQLKAVGGRYFEDCNEAALVDVPDPSNPPTSGVANYAIDPANADRLWQLSLSLLGL
jgi:NAD(P)-dependent dehydrogenase (short-subunit alcohol dehydrogenase family)